MLAPNTLLWTIHAQPNTTNASAAPPKIFRGLALRDENPRRPAVEPLNAPVLLRIRPTPEQFQTDPIHRQALLGTDGPSTLSRAIALPVPLPGAGFRRGTKQH
jgi:hypothetical protein